MQYHTIQSVLESMAASINDTGDKSKALSSLTYDQVDAVFDQIDVDNSGVIDADELKLALEKMGMKLTKGNVEAMIRVVDDNGDGVIDREEFHTLVNMATLRAEHKKEVRKRRKDTTQKLKHSILRSSTSEYPADTLGYLMKVIVANHRKVPKYLIVQTRRELRLSRRRRQVTRQQEKNKMCHRIFLGPMMRLFLRMEMLIAVPLL